jgi:hypothetical protein
MKRIFVGMLAVLTLALFGCGGGGGGNTAGDSGVKKAAVSGTVSFPALSTLVGKQVAVPAGTVLPPTLFITDLSGAAIATVTLTGAMDGANKVFTYSTNLDSSKDYVFKASWGGQVLRSLADRSTLSTLTTEINVTPVSTAAVLVAEQKLSIPSGTLGTTTNTATATQLAAVNPAAILATVTSSTDASYTTLVDAVTTALTGKSDPATVTTVTTAASSAAQAYTAPLQFTSTLISGKSFKSDSGSIISFHADGSVTTSKNSNVNRWLLNPDGTILLSYLDASTNKAGWDKFTLIQNNNPTSLVVSDLNIDGTTSPNATWTYYIGFTTAMISGKTFNYSDSAGNVGMLTFGANGNYTTANANFGTWSINASGQVVVIEPDETSTVTLVSNSGTDISATIVSSTAGTLTATLTTVATTNIVVADYGKLVGKASYIDYPNVSHTHYYDGVQTVSGRSVNVLRELDDVGSVLKETIYISADLTSGAYLLGANGTFFVNPYPVVLPSFVLGQEYGPYDIMGNGTQLVYVTWTFENVTVPYGTYTNALKQQTRKVTGSTSAISYNWYVQGIGGVKWQDGSNASNNEVLTGRNFTWPNSGDVTAQW